MKLLLILLALGVGGYFFYQHRQDRAAAGPEVIETPVYAEIRMDMAVAGRELNFVLFGRMASEEDCRTRANLVWQKTFVDCKECRLQVSACKAELEPRYQRLFDNAVIHSTYVSFTRGSRAERDGRMVLFGITADEGDAFCAQVKQRFQSHYTGIVECVIGRRD